MSLLFRRSVPSFLRTRSALTSTGRYRSTTRYAFFATWTPNNPKSAASTDQTNPKSTLEHERTDTSMGTARPPSSGLDTQQKLDDESLTNEKLANQEKNYTESKEEEEWHEITGNTRSLNGYPKPTSGEQLPSRDPASETYTGSMMSNKNEQLKPGSDGKEKDPIQTGAGQTSQPRGTLSSSSMRSNMPKDTPSTTTASNTNMAGRPTMQKAAAGISTGNQWNENENENMDETEDENVKEWADTHKKRGKGSQREVTIEPSS